MREAPQEVIEAFGKLVDDFHGQQQQAEQELAPDRATVRELMYAVNQITDAELPDRPTTEEVARWLRKSPNWVYNLAKKGKIPCKKVERSWLFDKASLLKWAQPEEAA